MSSHNRTAKRKKEDTNVEEQPTATLTKIKKDLGSLANKIVSDDEYSVDDVDKLIKISQTLKSAKTKASGSALETVVPPEYRCPISNLIMQDPVVVVTGYTYDRCFIEKWLKEGNRVCPLSQKEITDALLVPNRLLQHIISNWCKDNGVEFSTSQKESKHLPKTNTKDLALFNALIAKLLSNPQQETEYVPKLNIEDLALVDSLLVKLFSSKLPGQKSAVKELLLLTNRLNFDAVIRDRREAIDIFISPLTSTNLDVVDPDLHVNVLTLLRRLLSSRDNKKLMGEHKMVVSLLIESLRCGPPLARTIATAALSELLDFGSNSKHIVEAGAIKALAELLEETENMLATKAVVTLLFKLCISKEVLEEARINKIHRILLQKMADHAEFVDVLLIILDLFSTNMEAMDELKEFGAFQVLLSIIKKLEGNASTEEISVALLHDMCYRDKSLLRLMEGDQDAEEAISAISLSGTTRAKTKADGLLQMIEKSNYTHPEVTRIGFW